MMKFFSSLVFIAKYILIGLGIAALFIVFMPDRFGIKSTKESNLLPQKTAIVDLIGEIRSAVVTLQAQSKPYPINSVMCLDGVRQFSQHQNACLYSNNGSGVIIDNQGHLVTSAHVVTFFSARGKTSDAAKTILVEFANGQKTTAKLLGFDLESDLALLKLPHATNHFLPLSDLHSSRVGESVYAIGTPYMGFKQTVTSGIISARFFAKVSNYIQTDAQLRSGNSGGALINEQGQLIGITQLSAQELSGEKVFQNFAIEAGDVARIVKQLKTYGQVKRGWLGLNGDMSINLASIARENQLSDEQIAELRSEIKQLPFGMGIVVTGIDANGPADQAGLQVLDVVTKVNGKPIYNTSDLLGAIWNKSPNDKVTVSYWRHGKKQQTEVVLGDKG